MRHFTLDKEAEIERIDTLLKQEGLSTEVRRKLQDSSDRKSAELERYNVVQRKMKDQMHHKAMALQLTKQHQQREEQRNNNVKEPDSAPPEETLTPIITDKFDWTRFGNMGASSTGSGNTIEIEPDSMLKADTEIRRSEYDKQTEKLENSAPPVVSSTPNSSRDFIR